MVGGAIKTAIVGVGPLSDAVVFTSTMAIRCMNKNAASVEAGGVGNWTVLGSEGRVVDVGRHVGPDHVVCRVIVVVAMDLIAVARLEQVEEVIDEVVDLNDGIVAERGHRDVGAGAAVSVVGHGDG